MIASISSAASALRPVERPAIQRPPVEPPPAVEQVRTQAPTREVASPRAAEEAQRPPPPRPTPRGSLLDLSV
jgi:hypothetical protein